MALRSANDLVTLATLASLLLARTHGTHVHSDTHNVKPPEGSDEGLGWEVGSARQAKDTAAAAAAEGASQPFDAASRSALMRDGGCGGAWQTLRD
jgi:hypothetical protein